MTLLHLFRNSFGVESIDNMYCWYWCSVMIKNKKRKLIAYKNEKKKHSKFAEIYNLKVICHLKGISSFGYK